MPSLQPYCFLLIVAVVLTTAVLLLPADGCYGASLLLFDAVVQPYCFLQMVAMVQPNCFLLTAAVVEP